MSDKQIPSPEEYIEQNIPFEWIGTTKDYRYPDIPILLSQYAKEVVKYTLEQAAENAYAVGEGSNLTSKGGSLYWTFAGNIGKVVMKKESILSLESQIIKDLKL